MKYLEQQLVDLHTKPKKDEDVDVRNDMMEIESESDDVIDVD